VSVTGRDQIELADWDRSYDEIERQLATVTRGRAIQNHVFVEALRRDPEAACALIRARIRPGAGRAVVTLGSAGAVVLPADGSCYWIEAEATVPDANSSALGCGDTFRGALVGALLREGITTDATFELGARMGVHAGTTKFRHMRLTEALAALAGYENVKLAASALRRHDLRVPADLELLASRVTL
jgi:sugar/nucleoside kinase (ribokinase family)